MEAQDQLILTAEDDSNFNQGLPLMHYNAYLLYANEDVEFAAQIIDKLENKYNLDIFVKERNLMGGVLEIGASISILANRCDKVIVILSPAFLASNECKYLSNFAHSIGIGMCNSRYLRSNIL